MLIAGASLLELLVVGAIGATLGYGFEKLKVKLNKKNFDAEFDRNWNAFEEKRKAMGLSKED